MRRLGSCLIGRQRPGRAWGRLSRWAWARALVLDVGWGLAWGLGWGLAWAWVLAGVAPAWAACKMTTPPTASPATATLTAAGPQAQRLRAPTISGHFTFSCDAPTNYRLLFQDSAAGTPGSATFRSGSGAELQGQLRLRQVCGQKVDTEVARLPITGYSGTAAAGQSCASTFDVVFADSTVLPRQGLGSPLFNAALQVIIEY